MKRPKTQMPKRPRTASSAAARTPKEAAISLVRLEFDTARLQLGTDQAENRYAGYSHELERNQDERRRLIAMLSPSQDNGNLQ